ncbi:hypothetical protein TRSC58_07247 [Trypanosoma rangeli SC58]|uniref:Uncharacterized protein n=1 Tax=Trypanosoma rangeli SC58 TaxID=429131 RepID=A0A061ITN0_TRYRA|nr:hypothetical protein TRSC58_07247 [Trypanosoma rangeli SC58]
MHVHESALIYMSAFFFCSVISSISARQFFFFSCVPVCLFGFSRSCCPPPPFFHCSRPTAPHIFFFFPSLASTFLALTF